MSFFSDQSRTQLRTAYRDAWHKWCEHLPLQPFELQLAEVILAHPEYQELLQDQTSVTQEFPTEGAQVNPFLHLGLHLALREQLSTDRPQGIVAIYRRLTGLMESEHVAEHRMMELLAEALEEARRNGRPPEQTVYLERLRRLL